MEIEHILVAIWPLKLQNLQVRCALIHLMLLPFYHDDAVEHIKLLNEQERNDLDD